MLRKLVLITTYRCDLHCQHCLQGFPREHSDFPVELLPKLLNEAMPFGARHVTLTGGEAHLHPQFEKIVETIVNYGYTWNLISHGQRTEPYLPLMEKYRSQFTSVGLSMDGATPELHDELRGRKGAFESVTASARLYIERGFPVWVKTSLNQKNKAQVEDLAKLAVDLGAQGVIFGGTIPADWNQHLVLGDNELLELYQRVISLQKNSPVELKITSSLHTQGGVNFCGVLSLSELTISPRGNVDFCCDVHQPAGAIGSLRDTSFSGLIHNWLEESAKLQQKRAERIVLGAMGERFDTCAYCNFHFAKITKV
jgi:MoaA/NifB/PqqE/SkfB family radical SAM enzyme